MKKQKPTKTAATLWCIAAVLILLLVKTVFKKSAALLGLYGWRSLAVELVKYTETSGTKKPVLKAYWDYEQWSVGYGSFAGSRSKTIAPFDNIITPNRADELLTRDVNSHAAYVLPHVKGWKMYQIAAVVDMAYNLPAMAVTFCKMVNSGSSDKQLEAYLMSKNTAGGVYSQGVVNRRKLQWRAFKGELFYL